MDSSKWEKLSLVDNKINEVNKSNDGIYYEPHG